MTQDLARAGIGAILGMLVGLVPLVVALAYLVRPGERLLALMRPLSLAAIFAALHTLLFGSAAVVRNLPASRTAAGYDVTWIAHGVSESLTPVFLIFGFLTAAWLVVAAGMSRES